MSIDRVIEIKREFFKSGATLSLDSRKKVLSDLARGIEAYEDKFFHAIHEDFGKSPFETSVTEINMVLREIRSAKRSLKRWSRRRSAKLSFRTFPARGYIYRQPLGVVLVVGAWNYPFQLTLAPAVAGLAAGNTAVLKPSEFAPNCSRVMREMIDEYCDSRVISVVEGGVDVSRELVESPFDHIFYTGGTEVGKKVALAAAKNLIPVTLELGGKSPAIIGAGADLMESARRIVWGKFLNAGQTCIAPDYTLVPESELDPFLDALRYWIEKFSYSLEGGNYVKIAHERAFNRLLDLMDPSICRIGGEVDKDRRLIMPSVYAPVKKDHPLMSEEIFGPLLPIVVYQDFSEVVDFVSQRPNPLAAYYFGRDRGEISIFKRNLLFGGGCINDTILHVAEERLPFGGIGYSGQGSYHGEAGFLRFTHEKSLLERPFKWCPPLRFPPYPRDIPKWFKREL